MNSSNNSNGGDGMQTSAEVTSSKLSQRPMIKEGSEPGRYIYEFNGKKIYEWDQNLDGT